MIFDFLRGYSSRAKILDIETRTLSEWLRADKRIFALSPESISSRLGARAYDLTHPSKTYSWARLFVKAKVYEMKGEKIN